MVFKKVCSFLMAIFYLCSVFSISASAVNYDTFEKEEIVSEYIMMSARNNSIIDVNSSEYDKFAKALKVI